MDNAVVLGKARVVGNAIVRDTAMLCQRAQAMGDVVVSGDTHMGDCSKASGCVVVHSQMLTGIDHLHKDKEAA
jgi:carbonic anhydrase/acetyltransferase-like protein (isoleucine patch superfamily)